MIGLIYRNICDETFKFKNRFYLKSVNFFTISGKSLDNSGKVKCNGDYSVLFLPYNMFRFLSYREIKKSQMLSMYKKILQIDDVKKMNYQYFLINKRSRLEDQFDSFSDETWYYIDNDKNIELYSLYYNIYFHKVLNNMYVHKGFTQFNKTYEDFVRSIKTILETYKEKINDEDQNIRKNDVLSVIGELLEILFLALKEEGIFEQVFFRYDRKKLNTFIPSYLSDDSVETIYTDVLNINMILDRYNKDFIFDCTLLMDVDHKNLEHKVSSNSALKFYVVMFRSGDEIKINFFTTCKMSDFYNECVILNKSGKSTKIKKEPNVNSQIVLHRFFVLNVKGKSKIENHIKNVDITISNAIENKMFLV